jgi:hypothetical protein
MARRRKRLFMAIIICPMRLMPLTTNRFNRDH